MKRTPRGIARTISDAEIYGVAFKLIDRYGEDAATAAAKMIDVVLDRGDREGCTVWQRICRAIVNLQAQPSGSPH